MIKMTVLFNNGVEKTFVGVTKIKRSGDLKHTEIYYHVLENEMEEHHATITDDQICMIDQVDMD